MISPTVVLIVIAVYFGVLIYIARTTSKGSSNDDFFIGSRESPWYIVAFGMIGSTLSGVTFISVPGWVGDSQFSYLQMAMGYIFGYIVIAYVLMPTYYRLKLTSIYSYLDQRFGLFSYKTGAGYFLLSRTIGASFRLFLVAIVLQQFLMDPVGIPFWVTVALTILLIWIYTSKGGIKTIIWTDTIQTGSILIVLIATIISITNYFDWSIAEMASEVSKSELSQVFFFEGGWSDPNNFWKQFLSGMFITIVMTGLDQDMMQKNLSISNLRDAQKNVNTFNIVLFFVVFLFLILGALLYLYAQSKGIGTPSRIVGGQAVPSTDLLFPVLAMEHLGPVIGVLFLVGLIAAAYSSADSALTSLTTSFCIDVLDFEKVNRSEKEKVKTRRKVHIGFSILLFLTIQIFWWINDEAVISSLFKVAGYTYGPLLGLYTFGFYTKRIVRDRFVPVICILAPILSYILSANSEALLNGYQFGFEILLVNGAITLIGLWLISQPAKKEETGLPVRLSS
ncbi:sodium:solute symporter [Membranicola marinus]|uniref:Sodium:solute symporter n=1 Tax=Membranihabitans marinus TaxID=1227546 RepID=A0A953HWA4_9BACT|nr:sodium:solute symporter [Membranihabitans marinus]MBY5959410.1 sodium:solute symporter [Membranihabitans marinus]